jgi:hypothetical protein
MSPPGLRFGTIRHVATRGEFENLTTVGDELGFRERINLLLPSPRSSRLSRTEQATICGSVSAASRIVISPILLKMQETSL